MLSLRETIEALQALESQSQQVRVQAEYDCDIDGVILPVQSVEIGVDGKVYIRAFFKR